MEISAAQIIVYSQILGGLAVCGIGFWGYNKYLQVKQSIGWNFVTSVALVKRGAQGSDLVLEIVNQSGKRTYQNVSQCPIINYEHMEKGVLVKKGVIYDERAVERINGIPVLKCSPVDIRPIDRETGLLVNIPSELIDKLAVDSAKSAENENKNDKERKLMIYALIGMCVLFLLALTYINQTNADLQIQLASASINAAKTATVIAG